MRSHTTTFSLTLHRSAELLLVLGLTIFLPFVAHVLPSWDDSPFGAHMLPIFYAPLVAMLLRRPTVGLLASVLAPWANHLLLGHPVLPVALILTLELPLFCAWVHLYSRGGRGAWIGPAAYLSVKPFSALLLLLFPSLMPVGPVAFVANSVITGWPGVLVLGCITWMVSRWDGGGNHAAA